jgi:hyaluronoglucosaminidase
VNIFWTGEKVCSPGYSDHHLEAVAQRLGRKPFIWDNHVANDGRERCSHLFLDIATTGWSLSRERVSGLAINPMNQPALSRLPLASFAARFFGAPAGSRELAFERLAKLLCGDALGADLAAARDQFQNRGIAGLDEADRDSLIGTFSRYAPQRCAAEVVAWLGGQFAFDPRCLTE